MKKALQIWTIITNLAVSLGMVATVLLLVLAIIVGLTLGAYVFYQHNQEAVTYSVAAVRAGYFAWRMDRLYDRLPDVPIELSREGAPSDRVFLYWGQSTNSQILTEVSMEVLPYFDYEGIVERPIIPRQIYFIPFAKGADAFHIGGRASCQYAAYILNWNYANRFSPRFQRDSLLPNLVHELGHVQGMCSDRELGGEMVGYMESSNQVATWEVLCSMSLHGNRYAIKPTIGELRNAAMDYLRGCTYGNGTEGLYKWFALNVIYSSQEERLRILNSWQYWEGTEHNRRLLHYIVVAYGMKPYSMAMTALADPDLMSEQSMFFPNRQRKIKVDDLDLFLRSLGEIEKIARGKDGL